MSTNARTITVHNPIRWFIAGVATTVASVALAAGLAWSALPAAQPPAPAADAATYSLSDPALRLQRAGEIRGGSATGSLSGLTEHRKGEINEGSAGSSLSGLTEQRKGEINGGQ